MRWFLPLEALPAFALMGALSGRHLSDAMDQQHRPPQGPQLIQANRELHRPIRNREDAGGFEDCPEPLFPASTACPDKINAGADRGRREEEGTEFTPVIFGYKAKITEIWSILPTLVLAFYTARLSKSTDKLWASSEMQSQHTERALLATQRAFVFGQGFSQMVAIQENDIKGYLIFVTFKNVGVTPAVDVRNSMKFTEHRVGDNSEIKFRADKRGPMTVIGPHAPVKSGYMPIPLANMVSLRRGETGIFVWSRIEYRDVFDRKVLHHHEQCAQIKLLRDPTAVPSKGDSSAINFEVYGPQNTTG
jgi:hypothetical protein